MQQAWNDGSHPTSIADCAVIGAGPAGLTAAYYLRRFHRRVWTFDDGNSRAHRIPLSHNYPGFPDGISGTMLLDRLHRQLATAGGRVHRAHVSRIDLVEDGFLVHAAPLRVRARCLLLATGTRDIEPRIDGIDDIRARGLLRQCPICDGFEWSGRRIAVIGTGAHGRREAAFLRGFSNTVELIDAGTPAATGEWSDDGTRRGRHDGGSASPSRVEHRASGVLITLDDDSEVECDVVYAAMGSVPQSRLAAGLGIALDDHGNIRVDAHGRTSLSGVYAAGDIVVGLDQLAVAVGHGAIAATAIHNDLRPTPHRDVDTVGVGSGRHAAQHATTGLQPRGRRP